MRERASADAPGRVNLMGEHTDYHDGYVLPTIIPQRTQVHVQRRRDRRIRASSAAFSADWLEYETGHEARGRDWLDYVQGVTATLASHGVQVPGFDVRIESTIPLGAGVSSSAALEVSLMRALRTLLSLDIDDVELARMAQAVETQFVGAPVGIMDQMAASLGRDREALFLDTRTLAVQRLPLPPLIEIVVIDSRIPHAHASGAYAVRRRESFEAAALLGVERLRDVGTSVLARIEQLPPILARRARHIVTENQRVLDTVEALRANDAIRLGALFDASQASMRDDYETSTPEIDVLVEIGRRHHDVYGARLTGGGFGGAVVMLAKCRRGRAAADEICDTYTRQTQREGRVLVPLASGRHPRITRGAAESPDRDGI
jgi:galactokinase